ncbi:uncharacterized protein Z520_06588 [Fonsecaea multimorphosa CBS 102226]|uniref:Uncharacterized protein n=1 Tax=Fonsecaea multimorphosa CBS 102226 TaxID=1442371 RepID=A0A0D2H7J9_9EURO|nr:uncharacterized protein Z520_06588 [Fonsecaea multimorphosa CBS 102226]KIX97810.1 hypothetical protein Z520_06588 [Fonsecaea multimorphosa CBS 102226]
MPKNQNMNKNTLSDSTGGHEAAKARSPTRGKVFPEVARYKELQRCMDQGTDDLIETTHRCAELRRDVAERREKVLDKRMHGLGGAFAKSRLPNHYKY